MLIQGLEQGKRFARDAAKAGKTIGTIHTLGALHRGHAELIKRASAENDITLVTVYPNKIQLLPGQVYKYDLNEDIELAMRNGATAVMTASDAEMFDEGYSTYIWPEPIKALDGMPGQPGFLHYCGSVTGAIRWISLLRPTRSYFGLKDIEQALNVNRAVKDLFMECEIVFVPTVRWKSGVPLSSRIRFLGGKELDELAALYRALDQSRQLVAQGERSTAVLTKQLKENTRFEIFKESQFRFFDENLREISEIKIPFVISATVKSATVKAFDNIFVRNERDLKNGPESIWLDKASTYPTLLEYR